MRIIAGESKGRKIKVPKGIRPTQDKVRESIFNILGDRVVDTTVLDLFAGSGSFGLEAISRGAREAIFVEINPKVIKILRENIDTLGYKAKTRVIQADALKIIQDLVANIPYPDIVFADPPYNKGFVGRVVQIIKANNSTLLLILEHSKEEKVNMGRTLHFGDTEVNVIEFKELVN
ncbi:MAG TPA: 16S rRNA (guanine(966)-N(2))-methyltransferase RsmD, partial [bacterium (Candidatus Stahlbacteria)]|nr:16S rRNA (guanine(966)-N(2))-methyltransferase RsmD [Candidatus Stahlbacteria bacterium]